MGADSAARQAIPTFSFAHAVTHALSVNVTCTEGSFDAMQKEFDMKTQANKRFPLLASIMGIAVILFSAAGTAAITGWGQTSTGGPRESLALDDLQATTAEPVAGHTRTKTKCAECGVISSMREIQARSGSTGLSATGGAAAGNPDEITVKSTRYYEFTIRMADRSLRLVNDENPANWRLGERVILIDGNTASTQ